MVASAGLEPATPRLEGGLAFPCQRGQIGAGWRYRPAAYCLQGSRSAINLTRPNGGRRGSCTRTWARFKLAASALGYAAMQLCLAGTVS